MVSNRSKSPEGSKKKAIEDSTTSKSASAFESRSIRRIPPESSSPSSAPPFLPVVSKSLSLLDKRSKPIVVKKHIPSFLPSPTVHPLAHPALTRLPASPNPSQQRSLSPASPRSIHQRILSPWWGLGILVGFLAIALAGVALFSSSPFEVFSTSNSNAPNAIEPDPLGPNLNLPTSSVPTSSADSNSPNEESEPKANDPASVPSGSTNPPTTGPTSSTSTPSSPEPTGSSPVDVLAPIVSNIGYENSTAHSVQIYWTLVDESGVTSRVEYGLTSNYGFATLSQTGIGVQNVVVGNLASDSIYHYRIRALDAGGHETLTPDATFSTLPENSVLPLISNVHATDVTPLTVQIHWTLGSLLPVQSWVEYGTTTQYGFSSLSQSGEGTHSVPLVALLPDTLYHYRIRAVDEAGASVQSSDFTFTTSLPITSSLPTTSLPSLGL